jgi:hypothetical protein
MRARRKKLFGILLDAENGLAKPAEEALAAIGQPQLLEIHRVVEVVLNPLQKFDRLALHDQARRRSSSESGMRLILPVLYATQRSLRISR